MGRVTKILILKLMDKHEIATEKIYIYINKLFSEPIQIFFQKYVGHVDEVN